MAVAASGDLLETGRLRLRRWRIEDAEPLGRINADPAVTEFLPTPIAPATELIALYEEQFRQQGFGLWAVERRDQEGLMGYIGLHRPSFTAAFTPCVEVGWRLGRGFWGQGFATEGARAVLAYGFGPVGLAELVSLTAVGNTRSRRVMEKLGMRRDPSDDFEHPRCPAGNPLRPHVLYRLSADAWRRAAEHR